MWHTANQIGQDHTITQRVWLQRRDGMTHFADAPPDHVNLGDAAPKRPAFGAFGQ